MKIYTIFRPKNDSKTISFGAAHTYIHMGFIGEFPSGGGGGGKGMIPDLKPFSMYMYVMRNGGLKTKLKNERYHPRGQLLYKALQSCSSPSGRGYDFTTPDLEWGCLDIDMQQAQFTAVFWMHRSNEADKVSNTGF